MLKRLTDFLNEYLRINAIRRMLAIVDVNATELLGLVGLAVLFAAFEGIGLSLLLPILQIAEGGETAITQSSGGIWGTLGTFMNALHLPVTLPVLLVLAFLPILLRQVVFYFNTWYSAFVSSQIGIRMRMQTLDTVFAADPDFFSRHAVGAVVGVIVNQTTAAGQAILAIMKQFSIALLMLLYLAILLAISVPLTIITIAFAGLVSAAVKANFARIRDFGVEAARVNQEMLSKIFERMSLIRLIKLRDQENAESARIEGFSEATRAIGVKQARIGAIVEVTADPLLMLSVFVTLYVGIAVLHMTLAQLGLTLFLLNRLNAKVKEFNAGRQLISANMSGILLVKEMAEEALASNTIRGGEMTFAGLKHEIRLDGISFSYPDDSAPSGAATSDSTLVLHDVSLTIPAGSFTALVGRSGAGKSTLVELLPRLRDPDAGTTTFDGVDIKEFEIGSLRKGVGYLTQSAMLFNDTVRANLVYGLDRQVAEDEIRDALARAYATFVYELPKGLETSLGDRGVRFSGGERQRIALARVLLQDTSILILDEPTSALDSESETYIQRALQALHGDKTLIVIAHRLATVIQADQLLVVDEGRIVERGTHYELLAMDGTYHRLFESQLLA